MLTIIESSLLFGIKVSFSAPVAPMTLGNDSVNVAVYSFMSFAQCSSALFHAALRCVEDSKFQIGSLTI